MKSLHFARGPFVHFAIGTITVGILAAPGTALAQDGWKSNVWTGIEYQGDTDIDDAGDFSFWMVQAGAGTKGKLSDSVSLNLKGDYRAIDYSFEGNRDPWSTIHVARLNPVITYHFNEDWSMFGGPIGEFTGENGADVSDSLRGGGMAGAGWKPNDNLSIALGAILHSEIEDDAYVQPFVLVNWGITDGLAFNMDANSSRGGELMIRYTFGDSGLTIGAGGGFRRERFRLDDDQNSFATSSRGRSSKDGVGEETATLLKASVSYVVNESVKLDLYGGVTIDGEFRLEDEDGHKIAKSDYDNAGFGGIRATFMF